MVRPSVTDRLGSDPLNMQVEAPDITPDDLEAVYTDLYKKVGDGTDNISSTRRQFIDVLKSAYGTPQGLQAPTPEILGKTIKAATQLGVVDDIAAGFSRNIRRLKGDRLKEGDVSEVFNQYGIALPPISDIDFSGETDGEAEKLDGWNAKAKATYNLNARTKSPELLAYRDEVFQRLDDTTKYLKRKVGATDSGTIDFLGRLVEGAATTLDTIGLEAPAEFLRAHVSTNPDWDASTSALVGQSIGQAASLMAGILGAGEAAAAAGATGIGLTLAEGAFSARSAFHGAAKERYDKVLADTGNETLADEATHTAGFYLEAGLDTVADTLVLGSKLPIAGKLAERLAKTPELIKDGIAKALGETAVGATLKGIPYLTKAAELAGDAVTEGATEALQGAIQDADTAALTNEPDKFQPFALEQRANDFLGGAVGGGFATGVRYVGPSIQKKTQPLVDKLNAFTAPLTDPISNVVGATRNYINEQVDAVQAQAHAAVGSMLERVGDSSTVANVAESVGGAVQKVTSGQTKEYLGDVYKGAKERLGGLMQHPRVQNSVESVMSLYDKFSNREEKPTSTTVNSETVVPPVSEPDAVDTAIAATTADLTDVSHGGTVDTILDTPTVEPLSAPAVKPIPVAPVDETTLPTHSRERTGSIQSLLKTSDTAADSVAKTTFPIEVANEAVGDNAPIKGFFTKMGKAYQQGKGAPVAYDSFQKYMNSQDSQTDLETAGLDPERAQEYRDRYNGIVKANAPTHQERLAVNKLRWELLNEVSDRPTFEKALNNSNVGDVPRRTILKAFPNTPKVEPKRSQSAPTLTANSVSDELKQHIVATQFEQLRGHYPSDEELAAGMQNADAVNQIVDHTLGRLENPQTEEDVRSQLDVQQVTAQPTVTEKKAADDTAPVKVTKDPTLQKQNVEMEKYAKQLEASGDTEGAKEIRKMMGQTRSKRRKLNQGALLPKGNRSSLTMKRVFNRLGIDVNVADLSAKDSILQPTGEAVSRKNISLEQRTLNSKQAPTTLLHELGETALDASPALTSGLDAVAVEAQTVSDASRITPSQDTTDHKSDLIASYLDNPASVSPEARAILEKSTVVKEMRKAIAAEDAIPVADKMREEMDTMAQEAVAARAALASRNENTATPRERIAKAMMEIRAALFNKAAPLYDAAAKLAKENPLYIPLVNTLKRTENQFKNRNQTGMHYAKTLVDWYHQRLLPSGASLDNFNAFLYSNKILNQRTFWENHFLNNPAAQQQALATLQAIPEANALITPDVLAQLTGTPQQFVDGLNEVVTRAYVEGTSKAIAAALPPNSEELKTAITIPTNIRANIENYKLESREDAQAKIDALRNSLTPEQFKVIEDGQRHMGDLFLAASVDAHNAGRISRESLDFIKLNAASYSTTQLADAVTDDPYIDGSTRNQQGTKNDAAIAPPFEVSIMKLEAMAGSTARFNFQNTLADFLYASSSYGGPKIKPVLKTGDSWFVSTGRNPANTTYADVDKFYSEAKRLESENPDKAYIVTAEDGDFVLHESDAGYLNEVIYPKSRGRESEILNAFNSTQILARGLLTSFSLPFAARSAIRMASKINSIQGLNRTSPLTVREVFRDMLRAPIAGVPILQSERNNLRWAFNTAGDYLQNANDIDRRLAALGNPAITTLQDLLNNPDVLFQLERQGDIITPILSDIVSGLDPNELQNSSLGSTASSQLETLLTGKTAKPSLLKRVNQSNLTPAAVKTASRLFTGYLDYVKNLNTRLELTEKLSGIRAYMEQGESFESAVAKANLYFGNPDPRGGGTLKPLLSPVIMFATPAMNDMRNLGEIYRDGFSTKDPRLLKMATTGIRNALVTHPLVWGAASYAVGRALLGSDDEARKQAEVIQKLVQNIPIGIRSTGNTIPLFFRNPRTGDWSWPWAVNSVDELDPTTETVYLQFPIDRTSAFTTGLVGNLLEAVGGGVGTQHLAGNLINSAFRSAAPSPGPVLQGFTAAYQAGMGQNPIDWYTGKSVANDDDFKQGGIGLGLEYAHYLANNFAPIIPYSTKQSGDKTRIAEPFGWDIFNEPGKILKLGILNSSNYGSVQARQSGDSNLSLQVKEDVGSAARDKNLRYAEINRSVKQRLDEAKQALQSQGIAPSSVRLKSSDYIPESLRQEFTTLKAWKDGPYKLLLEQAEMERRQNGTTPRYKQLMRDVEESAASLE